ncbi:MAG: hypothetical protein V4559_15905 [Pseudomonadota bacterium]
MSETGVVSGSILANKAVASAWEAWAKMRPLVVSAMIASSIVGVGFALAEGVLGVRPRELSLQNGALELAKAFAEAVIATPVAVAMHRLILKGEVTAGIISLRHSYHWLFLAWVCLFLLAQNVLIALAQSDSAFWLAAIVAIGVAFLWLRSALLFPAIAIEEQSAGWWALLLASWRRMDGHFWLFIRALLVALIWLLALVVLYLVVVVIMGLLLASLAWATGATNWGTAGNLEVAGNVLAAAAAGILAPVGIMLPAGIASWLYLETQSKPIG